MAPTLVNVAFGALLAAALLGAAFDRRSVLLVLAAAALPDTDAVASLFVEGVTNAMLHSLFVPAIAAALVYWDVEVREVSWLRRRYGWWGIRVAWVSLAAYVVAGIGVDLFAGAGANLLYPLHDRFYAIDGRFLVSTREGMIQTYVALGDGLLEVGTLGTTADYHVESWVNPTPGTGVPADAERRIRLVDSEFQLVAVVSAVAVLAIRFRENAVAAIGFREAQ